MNHLRLGNLLAALSLSVMDQVEQALAAQTTLHPTAISALVLLSQHPSQTIDSLSKPLHLAHSSTVRLVDRLLQEAYIQRQPGSDKRTVLLSLTNKGEAMVRACLLARQKVMQAVTEPLSDAAAMALEKTCEMLLSKLTSSREVASRNCRLCDENQCDLQRCPVEGVCASFGAKNFSMKECTDDRA